MLLAPSIVALALLLAPQRGAKQEDTGGFRLIEPFPAHELDTVLDLGVADFDGGGRLDVFTVNHSRQQALWANEGDWTFVDRFAALGLHQDPAHPGLEGRPDDPETKPGTLRFHWRTKELVVTANALEDPAAYRGSLSTWGALRVIVGQGFETSLETDELEEGGVRTTLTFTPPRSGAMRLEPEGVSAPMELDFEREHPERRVVIGHGDAETSARTIPFALRDRHGMAWSDVDDDGRLDVFIARGGLGGTLEEYPFSVRDELLLRTDEGLRDVAEAFGLPERSSRARRSTWYDVDGDGRLDLVVTAKQTPLHVYLRRGDGLVDATERLGLGAIADENVVIADLAGDARPELLVGETGRILLLAPGTSDDDGFTLLQELPIPGYCPNLLPSDFDEDGDRDVIGVAGDRIVYLENDGGTLRRLAPRDMGLPLDAQLVDRLDYDNDGDLDVYTHPGGLYAQVAPMRFEAVPTPRLTTRAGAKTGWADLDGDGDRDLLFSIRNPRARSWVVQVQENPGAGNHWLEVDLVGPAGNREAIGASASVTTPGVTRRRWVGEAEGSLFCQGHYRLYFGLGAHDGPVQLDVLWPNGRRQRVEGVATDRLLRVAYDE